MEKTTNYSTIHHAHKFIPPLYIYICWKYVNKHATQVQTRRYRVRRGKGDEQKKISHFINSHTHIHTRYGSATAQSKHEHQAQIKLISFKICVMRFINHFFLLARFTGHRRSGEDIWRHRIKKSNIREKEKRKKRANSLKHVILSAYHLVCCMRMSLYPHMMRERFSFESNNIRHAKMCNKRPCTASAANLLTQI